MQMRTIKLLVSLAVLVILFVVITIQQGRASVPQQFHGVLEYPVMRVGAQGPGGKLVMANKTIGLFIPRKISDSAEFQVLLGKQVIISGFTVKSRSQYRPPSDAIKVVSIAPDSIVLESPVGQIDDPRSP